MNRRRFLSCTLGSAGAALAAGEGRAAPDPADTSRRQADPEAELRTAGAARGPDPAPSRGIEREIPKIAALVTEYRENSHADVIVTKFLEGCKVLDVNFQPRARIASLYLDQTPANDLGHIMARKHQVPLFPTIAEALTLGTDRLAVDGVLLIGEHGHYPYNELGQHLYPRKRMFDAAAEVIGRSERAIPLFCDKHLSYSWEEARAMYESSRSMHMPLMAGSSLPYTWRKPDLHPELGIRLTEGLVVGFGGVEAYGFHALEALQCMAERRQGGETGVRSVQCLSGDAVWLAADQKRWNWDLLRAALSRSERMTDRQLTNAEIKNRTDAPDAFLLEYRDGFRATVLMLYGLSEEFLFAAHTGTNPEPLSTLFWLQEGKPFGHFARLCLEIDRMFVTGRVPVPVERTLLTTGVLAAAMRSRNEKGKSQATPELAIRYQIL